MPWYDYKCTKCTEVKSIIMSIARHEKEQIYCDKCNSLMYQQVAAPAIVNRANLRIARAGRRTKIL